MATGKKGFVLYTDLIHTVRKMKSVKKGKEQVADLFYTILEYVNDEPLTCTDPIVDLIFESIKQQLKRDLVKYEATKQKRSEAGIKSAEVKKQQKLTNSTSVESVVLKSTKSTVIDNVIVNGNVNDTDISIGDIPKTENQIEIWFSDLGNSSHIQEMARTSKIEVKYFTDRIEGFRKAANSSYLQHRDFLDHFKKWAIKNPSLQQSQSNISHVKLGTR